MNFKTTLAGLCIIAVAVVHSYGELAMVREVGVGTEAFSLANNYVALSQDQSAMFWNPAGFAFLPVRGFNVVTDVLSSHVSTEFNGTSDASDLRRIRLPALSFMTAVPTSSGGLTFAVGFQNPYVFDDNLRYHGHYNGSNINSLTVNSRPYGGLNFYTGAFGVQVAPGLALGTSLSLVSGTEKIKESAVVNDTTVAYDDEPTYDYIGYDIRFGLMYAFPETYKIGARLVFPQTIWFKNPQNTNDKGQLYSPFSGAVGVSATYPAVIVSTELRFRTPYDLVLPDEQIPDSSAAHSLNLGCGLGVIVPLGKSNFSLRAGYSFDQYDPYTFAKKYNGESWTWSSADSGKALDIAQDRHLLTGGIAYTAKSFSIEAAYGMQFWKINTNGEINQLSEDHDFSRFSLSMSFRY
jgi:hypothetical protein